PERFKEVMPGNEMAFEVFKELARTRRRNADTVDPGIGRTRLGQRTLKCVFLIGTRSAHSIRASGLTAAQTGRTHDRTRPMLQQRQKVLAKAPSTHDPKRICQSHRSMGFLPRLRAIDLRSSPIQSRRLSFICSHLLTGRLAGTSFFLERFIGRKRRNAEMLEASAKSSNILSALRCSCA